MPRVDVPDYKTFVDFPDGTPPEEMQAVLTKQFPQRDSLLTRAKKGITNFAISTARAATPLAFAVAPLLPEQTKQNLSNFYDETGGFLAENQPSKPQGVADRVVDAVSGLAPALATGPVGAAAILNNAITGTAAESQGRGDSMMRTIGKTASAGLSTAGMLALPVGGVAKTTAGAGGAVALSNADRVAQNAMSDEQHQTPFDLTTNVLEPLVMQLGFGGLAHFQQARGASKVIDSVAGRMERGEYVPQKDINSALAASQIYLRREKRQAAQGRVQAADRTVDTRYGAEPVQPTEAAPVADSEFAPDFGRRGPAVADAETAQPAQNPPATQTGPALDNVSIEVARLKQEHPYWSDAEYLKEVERTTLAHNPETLPAATDMSTVRPVEPQAVRPAEDAPGIRRGVSIGDQEPGQRFDGLDRIADPAPQTGMLLNPEVLPARTDADRYATSALPVERPAEDLPARTVEPQSMENFNHDSLPTAAVTAADSLVLQDAAPQLKIAVVGTPAEIKALGKQPAGKTTWVNGDKAYVIDTAAAREKYGSVLEAKRALKVGDPEALGYPKRPAGEPLQTAAVTKAGEILTEPESIKQAAMAGDVAYAAEGRPADLAAKIKPVADALKPKQPWEMTDAERQAGGWQEVWHGSKHQHEGELSLKRGGEQGGDLTRDGFTFGTKDVAEKYRYSGLSRDELVKVLGEPDVQKIEGRTTLLHGYLKMENPLRVDTAGYDYKAKHYTDDKGHIRSAALMEYVKQMEEGGHDGIIFTNVKDTPGGKADSTVYYTRDAGKLRVQPDLAPSGQKGGDPNGQEEGGRQGLLSGPDTSAEPTMLHAGIHLPTLTKQAKDMWKHYTEKLDPTAPAGSVKAGFDANRKANATFGKKPIFDWLRREGIDVQANAQNELMRLGPEAVWARRQNDAISGATAKSGLVKERFRKETMDGMSLRERQAMSDMVAIDNDLGVTKPGYTKIFGKTDAELRAARSTFQQDYKLTDAEMARVENATRQYFDAWKGRTQRLLDSGLIDATQKQALDARDYSPKQFLEKIDPDTMQNMGGNRVSVPDSGIKRLKKGSDSYFRNDPVALLEEATDRIETRIARNEANQALAALPADNGVATPAVRIGVDKFAPAPSGFDQISYMVGGRREALNVRSDFAAEWHQADPLANKQLVDAMGWVSGASAVRAGSTGHNPLFALINMPVDAVTIWMQADKRGYSMHMPVAAAQMARNLVKVAGDAWKHEGRYEDWVNEKGARELLSNYGGITNRRAHLKPALQKISDITSKIGRFSEEVSRLAYREQLIKNGASPAEASLMAGEYVDFSRGGGLIKAVDRLGLPYLNAGMQGARSIGRSAGRDPAAFAIKTAYLLAGASALYGFNQMVNPTGWANTSDREKADNFIIMLPPYFNYIDKDGTEVATYFRIKKEQSMRPFLSMAEALWQKAHEGKDASQQVKMALEGAVPLSASQLLPPVAKMYLAYATNTDVYKQEQVWKGKQEIAPFAEYTNQTNPILTGVGKLTATTGKDGQLEGGVSPERLGRSLQQVFVPGNLFTKLGVGALTEAYEKMNPSDRVKFATSNYDKVVELARGSRILGGAKDTEQFREGIRDARTGTATQQFEVNKTLDAMVLRYVKTGKSDPALYDRITEYVGKQSGEARSRLENRIEGLVETAALPDRGWWMSVRALQPEDRADQFKARLKTVSPEEQRRMLEIADSLTGFASERFLDRYEER